MITTLTFEELQKDEGFISGLRNGEFILVLGAGFSWGVKNKSSITENIPTGKEFLEITNSKFSEKITDYNIAANLWKTKAEENNKLLNEFKNLFIANKQFEYKKFERVFIPDWHNIYTLNFDNVLDLAMKNIGTNYPIFRYPEDPINSNKSISHLHGKVTNDFTFKDIVFSPKDYIDSAKQNHSLYTSIHGDVKTNKKNIVIIGTQFTEQAIIDKFFIGLEECTEIKIYHFELENNHARVLSEFISKDYKFIQIKGVDQIFDFFEKNKHLIHKYDIEGAQVIDQSFINLLKTKTFTPNDFYISKLTENCQWYGCHKEWAIKRKFYKNLKEIVIKSFKEERVSNVSAVVYGIGGSGKSTQLRILALDLYNEHFKTVWIDNFDSFQEHSLKIIETNNNQNFLIFIEDWYRLSDQFKNSYIDVFNKLSTLPNVRIVIGDRTLKKIYTNKLFDSENTKFKIEPKENQSIIEEIAEIIPDWKVICNLNSTNKCNF